MFTEGEKTEPNYLTGWYQDYRRYVTVQFGDVTGVDPLTLVRAAVAAKDAEAKAERKGKGRAHDEVWCIFDTDEHQQIPTARQLAISNGIHLAVSNPCIELWFILHFEEQTAHIERGPAQHRSKQLLSAEKELSRAVFDRLAPNYATARQRAHALDNKHAGDGSPDGCNPSSNLWRIVDSIQSAAPQAEPPGAQRLPDR